jgi:pectinesterase
MRWNIEILIFLLVLPYGRLPAQAIPRDTSFTLASAARSIAKLYPDARAVVSDSTLPVQLEENIIYATVGRRELHLDLFSPKLTGDGIFPGVILIHGGGWRSGDRTMEHPLARWIASKGYVVATVEYRLSGEALYPAAVHDIKAAIRWMRKRGRSVYVDPTRLALCGVSAGGHLAALSGVTSGLPFFDGSEQDTTISTAVQAIIDIDGILDFTDPAESGKDTGSAPPSAGKRWLGASFSDSPRLWESASPVRYAGEATPPIAFINSSSARFHAGRDSMIHKMTPCGITTEVHSLLNTPHPFWLFHPWFDSTAFYVQGFLDRILK